MRETFEMSSEIGDLSRFSARLSKRLIAKITPICMTWVSLMDPIHKEHVFQKLHEYF